MNKVMNWIRDWIRKTDPHADKKYVLYEEKLWEIKERGKSWFIITNGSRNIFCRKEDVIFLDENPESFVEW